MIETIDARKILFENKSDVNAKIGQGLLQISNEKLRTAAAHILGAGGKRIRPALVLTAYKAVGGKEIEKAASVAAAMELIHNWTLIHDDIIDKSDLRRGIATVHTQWDQTVAILAGDMLNNLAYKLVAQSKFSPLIISCVLEELTIASMEVMDGEMMDVEFEERTDLTEKDYFKMIGKKTGALFSASAKVGAILGTNDEAMIRATEKYGERIGIAFQIQDDLLDITSSDVDFGKEIGKDIKEGKKTLMVLHALSHASIDNAEKLSTILSNDSTSVQQVQEVLEIMEEAGSIDYARQMLSGLVEEAIESLSTLPITPYRQALEELAYFTINRNN